MAELGEATVAIRAKFDKFDKDVQSHRGKLNKILGGIATGATAAIGVAVAGAGVAVAKFTSDSIKEFTSFQQGMNEVFTLLPGINQTSMDEMSQDVLDFSKDMGVLPEKVIPALYQAISAGVPKDNVFDFLATAQQAAIGGVTGLETAVDGISSVVNAYGADVISATEASDLMFTAVKQGKTTYDELSKSLFNVIPTAASLGVEFGDVTAALASMTAQGVPTSVATTQLRQLLVELSKEGSKTAAAFEEISGKSFADFIASGGNVQDALMLMEDHAAGAGTKISDMFSSVEAGNAALALTGGGTETFTNNLAQMESSAGATSVAFDQMNGGIGRSQERAAALMSTIKIGVGQSLEPLINKLIELGEKALPFIQEMMDAALPVIEKFSAEFGEKLGPAVEIIGTNLRRVSDALGLTNDEMTDAQVFADSLTKTLDLFVTSLEAVAVVSELVGSFMESLKNSMDTLAVSLVGVLANFINFKNELSSIELPDWLTPGSPTPLELGIRGIDKAISALPDFSSKFDVSPSFGGIPDGGTVDRSTNVSVDADANINNGSPIDDALTMAFRQLRQQVNRQMAGA